MFKTDYLGVLATQSTTGDTTAMMEQINLQLDNIKGITRETDDYGNLYVTKGKAETYPAFACHTDTVHKIYKTFTVHETALNYIFAYSEDEGFQQVGVGGDDKCGIIACLELLTRLKVVKCVFFLDEEQGCKGSAVGRLEFFDDCRYVIQIDRKGHDDIIIKGSGTELCSKEFEELLKTIGTKYDYKPTTGATTDVVKLKDRGLKISACNLSAGYYNPHTKQEYIDADALLNCIDFCIAISRIKTVYPHTKPAPAYSANKSRNSIIPWNAGSSIRRCLICNDSLGYNFGVLCNKCVIASLTLAEDYVEPEILDKPECQGCSDELKTIEEVAANYCYACQYCYECGVALDGMNEYKVGTCMSCFWNDDTNPAARPILCSDRECTNVLVTKNERLIGYCSNCVITEESATCMITKCGKLLENDTERETGICDECTQEYQ